MSDNYSTDWDELTDDEQDQVLSEEEEAADRCPCKLCFCMSKAWEGGVCLQCNSNAHGS